MLYTFANVEIIRLQWTTTAFILALVRCRKRAHGENEWRARSHPCGLSCKSSVMPSLLQWWLLMAQRI